MTFNLYVLGDLRIIRHARFEAISAKNVR